MLLHFTILAFNAMWRHKAHTLVSLISLVFGLSCFMFASIFADYSQSFDLHFPESERIFYLEQDDTPYTVGLGTTNYLRSHFGELERVVRATAPMPVDVTFDDLSYSIDVRYVEEGFFDIFPVPTIAGLSTGSPIDPNTALISEAAALRLFGSLDVVGQDLLLAHEAVVRIVGVTARATKPSHIESAFPGMSSELIVDIGVFDRMQASRLGEDYLESNPDQWGIGTYFTYLKFPGDHVLNESEFQSALDVFATEVIPQGAVDEPSEFKITPVNELVLSTYSGLTGGMNLSTLLTIAGTLILLIAGLNYSNLVIAQLSLRLQEIGMQKIFGANRSLLILQYSYEALLFLLIALLIAVLLVATLLSAAFNSGITTVNVGLLWNRSIWLAMLVAIALVVVIAGCYPASRTLRASLVSLLRPKGVNTYSSKLRSILVCVQFTISGALVILTLVSLQQTRSLTEQLDGDLIDPKIVITVPLDNVEVDTQVLANELTRHPSVMSTTETGFLPWAPVVNRIIELSTSADTNGSKVRTINRAVGLGFEEVMGVPILGGRSFGEEIGSDAYPALGGRQIDGGPYSIIIDELTAQRLGFDSGADAVGQRIYRHLEPPRVETPTSVEQLVIGVTGEERFQIINYSRFFGGSAYSYEPDRLRYLVVRVGKDSVSSALRHIDETWNELVPGVVIKRQFADELFYSSYQTFTLFGAAILALALFGFSIASIGLLGNATFITNIRQQEVGIRKVLGASSRRLATMLLTDFTKPVIVANIIAWPLGYLAAKAYISIFAVQTAITPLPFLGCLLLSVGISAIAVSAQSIKSARARPADILRCL